MAERRSRSKSARPGRRSNSKGVIGTSETKMKVSPKKSRREEKEEERSKFAKKKAKGETPVASSDDDEGNEVEGPQMMAGVASADDAKRDKDSTSKDDYDGSDNENDDEEDDDEPEKAIKKNFFSDENAAWLKPKDTKGKQTLLDSDDDDAADDDEMANDQDDSDDEEMEVERQSRLLDARHKEEKEEADEELRATVASHTSIYHLPTKEELEKDVDRVVPPSELKSHVESILEVLADFKQRREPGRSRKEYVDQLGLFIAELYGYLPELIEYFLTMFSPSEALEFVDNSDKQRPLVIRTNTLKTRRKDLAMALMKRGVSLDPLASWSKVGLKIMESPVPIGATPEYLSGHYMLQSAASMCPVLALSPQPNERVLDMSAAPGGKTSYIAQLMRNTGVVFANDLKADRQKATVANLHRLGVKNVITCAHDGRKLAKFFQQYKFDRVLLDAPCSGLGVISRDPSCKVQRTLADVQKTAHLQKELLLAAIDVLNHKSKTGGVMVYSTCSVSVTENEEVVNYALQKRDIKIVDTELDFGSPGFTRYQQKRFHPSLSNTRRFYPHVHNMDGFFVARIQKLSDKVKGEDENKEGKTKDEEPVEKETPAEDVRERTKHAKKKNAKTTQKEKKRKNEDYGDRDEIMAKRMRDKVSVPPKPQKQKKTTSKKNNSAKLNKPRRQKVEE